jgi:hypothetical protein
VVFRELDIEAYPYEAAERIAEEAGRMLGVS